MQAKKMTLDNITGKLSRSEMKNIMAGKNAPNYCGTACVNNNDCTVSALCLTCGTDRKCF